MATVARFGLLRIICTPEVAVQSAGSCVTSPFVIGMVYVWVPEPSVTVIRTLEPCPSAVTVGETPSCPFTPLVTENCEVLSSV